MAIDLSGLELADVQITVQGDSILVRTQKEDCIEDLRSLPSPIKCCFYTHSKMVSVEPHGTDTINYDQLLEEIEQAESEIEEQKELIFKLQQDEEFEGVSHSGNLKKARSQLKDMQRDLDELRRQLEEIEPFDNLATIALATLPE